MAAEFYKAFRPQDFAEVVGQPAAVATLTAMVENRDVPHAILFTGDSGCGKTTLARILKNRIGCGDADYVELNSADDRGIDTIRSISGRMRLAPIGGRCRVWNIDEAHKLTNDAQNALLKLLEDTPKQVYFFLATTDPQKLIAAIKTRCTEIKVKPVEAADMRKDIERVLAAAECEFGEAVLAKAIDLSEKSPRRLWVLLNQVRNIQGEDEQLQCLEAGDFKAVGFNLAQAIMRRAPWTEVSKILHAIEEDAEGVRRVMLGYAQAVMIGSKAKGPGGKPDKQAAAIIDCLEKPLYDIGKPGLVLACFRMLDLDR